MHCAKLMDLPERSIFDVFVVHRDKNLSTPMKITKLRTPALILLGYRFLASQPPSSISLRPPLLSTSPTPNPPYLPQPQSSTSTHPTLKPKSPTASFYTSPTILSPPAASYTSNNFRNIKNNRQHDSRKVCQNCNLHYTKLHIHLPSALITIDKGRLLCAVTI